MVRLSGFRTRIGKFCRTFAPSFGKSRGDVAPLIPPIDDAKMAKKIDLSVIDQFYSAQVSANESAAKLESLREDVKEAVEELIRLKGKPADFTGVIDYHGFKIRVQRPTSYAWEANNNEEVTSDPNHAIYLQQLHLQKNMNDQLKYLRAQLKATAVALADAHPYSKSIKRGFTIAIV